MCRWALCVPEGGDPRAVSDWKTTVVAVDVVSVVSRHTTSASEAIGHLVAETALLMVMGSRDTTTVR